MVRKLWLDVETTGLDETTNGIIQLACIVEDKHGKVLDTFEARLKPFKGCVYDKKAEAIHGKSKKIIKKYEDEKSVLTKFVLWLQKHQKGREQFSIAGYNSKFDMAFIEAWLKRHNVNFWIYFNYYDIDVFALVKILDLSGFYEGKRSKKLVAVCDTYNISINAHDAMSDIEATRKLHKKLIRKHINQIDLG